MDPRQYEKKDHFQQKEIYKQGMDVHTSAQDLVLNQ